MKFKKMIFVVLMLILTACNHQENMNMSDIYTDEDIENAIACVKTYFQDRFDGCMLITISYIGDSYKDQLNEYATYYESDEAIILISSFVTNELGGDGSLNPNDIYEDWQWILVRHDNDEWKLVDHGY